MTEVSLLIAFGPHIACVAGAVLAVALDAAGRRKSAVFAAILGLVAGAAIAFVSSTADPSISGDVVLSGTGFSGTLGVLCTLGALVVTGGWKALSRTPSGGGIAALLAFSVAAASAVAVGVDLLVVLIGLETMALCAYALVWSARTSASTEAAVKYFVQGAVATGLYVLGLAILIGLYGGSTSYVWIRGIMGNDSSAPVTTALVLIAVAFAYKVGAFPFHSWALDAFETAPPHLTALMAGIPKVAAVVAMVVLFSRSVFAGLAPEYQLWVFGSLAVLSMVFGAAGGLLQTSYTRMLAYSGVAQVGYALVGVSLGAVAMTAAAVLVAAYALAGAAAFLGAAAVRAARPDWDGSIAGLAGLGRERRALGVAMSVVMFSLIGMPLTAGFWGKFLVFGVAISVGYWWLALIGVIASVVSFGYYGAVVKSLYFDEAAVPSAADVVGEPDRWAEGVAGILALAVLAAGIVPILAGLQVVLRVLTFA